MKQILAAGLLCISILPVGVAFAYSETHDEYSLELKGFSPEMVQPVEAQIDRQEGRYPKADHTKKQGLFYNFINNNWSESTHSFTYDAIEPPKYPKQPE